VEGRGCKVLVTAERRRGILFGVAIEAPRSPGKAGAHHWMRTSLGLLSVSLQCVHKMPRRLSAWFTAGFT